MITRDIASVIQSINNIQNQASNLYWEEYWKYKQPFLPFFNIGPEQQMLVGMLAGQLVRAGTPPHLLILPLLGMSLLGSAYAYCVTNDTVAEVNNIEITNGDLNNMGFRFNLTSDQMMAFRNVLETYNIHWKINLKDFKCMLTELNQLNKQQTNFFSKQTVNDILSKYRKPASNQPILETQSLQFSSN
jgi:hypothetical protein